jgi:hypothetical protein
MGAKRKPGGRGLQIRPKPIDPFERHPDPKSGIDLAEGPPARDLSAPITIPLEAKPADPAASLVSHYRSGGRGNRTGQG